MVLQIGLINSVLEKLGRQSHIQVRPHLCSRVRFPRSSCKQCQEICPAGTITIQGEAVTLGEACTGCEICVFSCPSGVFALRGSREQKRRDDLQRGVERDGTARYTCMMDQEAAADATVVLPCLAALSEGYLTAPFAWGAGKVQLKRISCSGCPMASAMHRYERLLEETRRLLSGFDITADRLQEVDVFDPMAEEGPLREQGVPEPLGRREFFGIFRRRAIAATMNLLPETADDPGQTRWSRQQNPQRLFLLARLAELGPPKKPILSAEDVSLRDLEIAHTCIGCKICTTLCPSGALRREVTAQEETRVFLNVSKCTGCRICLEACPPQSISFTESVDLGLFVQEQDRELVRVMPRNCAHCGAPFRGILGDTCPRCLQKRHTAGGEAAPIG